MEEHKEEEGGEEVEEEEEEEEEENMDLHVKHKYSVIYKDYRKSLKVLQAISHSQPYNSRWTHEVTSREIPV